MLVQLQPFEHGDAYLQLLREACMGKERILAGNLSYFEIAETV